ncbi:MAG TPA: ATP-binding cassette domain-containing protein, partial [Elusimicrobiales bacterium]|nr:ATP-binding cassette domain-containing protein [Elusimicrobiales bacterium]
MVKAENLSRSYGPVKALDGVSFSAEEGRITAFLGPNGAGKTTTFKILAGFLYPDSGSVTLDGRDVRENSIECRKLIGYLPENNPLYNDLKVEAFLAFAAGAKGVKPSQRRARVDQVMRSCGLDEVCGRLIGR